MGKGKRGHSTCLQVLFVAMSSGITGDSRLRIGRPDIRTSLPRLNECYNTWSALAVEALLGSSFAPRKNVILSDGYNRSQLQKALLRTYDDSPDQRTSSLIVSDGCNRKFDRTGSTCVAWSVSLIMIYIYIAETSVSHVKFDQRIN